MHFLLTIRANTFVFSGDQGGARKLLYLVFPGLFLHSYNDILCD